MSLQWDTCYIIASADMSVGIRSCSCTLTLFGQGFCESPEARQAVGSQLVQDAWQHLGQLLGLGVASDGEGVGSEGGLHFGIVEVDDCSLICKHVDLQQTRFV